MKFFVYSLLLVANPGFAEWLFHANEGSIPATEKANSIEIISEPEDGKVHHFELFVDDQYNIEGFIRHSDEGTQEITFDDINNKDVVLAEVKDMPALKLRCDQCTRDQGGRVVLTYLYNGLMPSYKEFYMDLKRVHSTKWELFDESENSIQVLYLVSRILMGYLIGIDEILVNPTEEEMNSIKKTEGIIRGLQIPLNFSATSSPSFSQK